VPDPVDALLGVQRVQIDDRLPRRVVLAVLVQRRAAPDPADVVGVLPEVVVIVTALVDVGDPVVGVVDLQQLVVQLGVAVVLQGILGRGVLGLHPGHRLVPVDVFEPLVRVGIRRGGGEGAPVQEGSKNGYGHGSAPGLASTQG